MRFAVAALLVTSFTARVAGAQSDPPPAASGAPIPAVPAAVAPTAAPPEPAVAVARSADDERLERLSDVLGHYRAQQRDFRLFAGISGLVVAGVAIPAGAVLVDKNGGGVGWVAVAGGIGAGVGGLLTLLVPLGNLERVADGLEERRRSGRPAGQIVAETEADWRERVEAARIGRKIAGGLGVALGAAGLAAGTVVAASDRIGDLTRSEQSSVATALLVGGSASALVGVAAFFLEEPEETAWEVWRRARPGGPAPAARVTPQIAALPGGGYAGLGVSW